MWKSALLNMYYMAMLPSRRRAAAARAAAHRELVQVLFYHRVADKYPNNWTISTRSFAYQINWLQKHFDIVSLVEAQSRIESGRNDRPTVCITFDDGYAENCLSAIPLLVESHIPFTYFVSTNNVLNGEPFSHDIAAGRPLAVNTLQQLREMVVAGAEIGAHTRNHVDLGKCHNQDELYDEIVGSKRDLEAALDCDIRYFAFPYGKQSNISTTAFRVAYEAGFAGVCSAYGAYNFPGDDAFHLRRIHADREFIRFKNWLNVDLRKVRIQKDFDPGEFRERTGKEQSAAKDPSSDSTVKSLDALAAAPSLSLSN